MTGKINLSKLQTRVLSALVLIPLTLFALWNGGWPFKIFLLALMGFSLFEWVQVANKTSARLLYLPLGIAYLCISFVSFYYILEGLGLSFALLFVVFLWASDIGAYFVGKFIGGPKMATSISPNKTWAGFGGAFVMPGICGVVAALMLGLSPVQLCVVGMVTGAVGQAGDLLISFVKRQAAVKDTGDIIPGHGGVLDRIDSMLLAGPVFYVLMVVLNLAGS